MAKVDIITGFLGAGKTTLINKLLAEGLGGEGTALIENEFGDVSVDDHIIEDRSIQMRTLATGCICCTLKGDFVRNLIEIVEAYHPDRIIIEPTGLANLADMLKVCAQAGEQTPLEIETVITVVNAENLLPMLAIGGDFFTDQLAQAHFLLMSCTQLVDEEMLADDLAAIREQQPGARILAQDWANLDALEIIGLAEEAQASFAGVSADGHLDAGKQGTLRETGRECCESEDHGRDGDSDCDHEDHAHGGGTGHDHEGHEHDGGAGYGHEGREHHHVHEETGCSSLAFFPERTFSSADLASITVGIEGGAMGTILRAKGFLRDAGGGFVRYEYVYGRADAQPCAYRDDPRFVVIGRDLDQETLELLLEGGTR